MTNDHARLEIDAVSIAVDVTNLLTQRVNEALKESGDDLEHGLVVASSIAQAIDLHFETIRSHLPLADDPEGEFAAVTAREEALSEVAQAVADELNGLRRAA